MAMPREWSATTYDALPLPHESWGLRVLDRMRLTGTERVLDAGCGTGRDAVALLARWPQVRVVALDGSEQMLALARERLAVHEGQVEIVHADLSRSLGLDRPVDAVMSVAAFHWIPDHEALFAHLADAMVPGARLTSDCGGRGNLRHLDRAIAHVIGDTAETGDWHFAGTDDTTARLTDAGFEVEQVALRPDPFRCEDPEVLESFLATVILGAHLERVPQDDRAPFVREVRRALEEPVVDYVRLEIDAVRR